MDDYEVRRNVWDSGIPVEFRLGSDTLQSVKPFFTILRRVEYFPTALGRALQFFSNMCPGLDISPEPWLESKGVPLKWHYPVGVLFDMHSNTEEVPWVVVVRLKDFPDELIRKDDVKNCFLQSVKEADQLKHKGQVMSEMRADEHVMLFDSVCNGRFDDFWSVNQKLMDCTHSPIQHVPLRFYRPGQSPRQTLVQPQSEDHQDVQLGQVIDDVFDSLPMLRVISHGIAIPLETPVLWLARNLSYPDNFVHLVVLSDT